MLFTLVIVPRKKFLGQECKLNFIYVSVHDICENVLLNWDAYINVFFVFLFTRVFYLGLDRLDSGGFVGFWRQNCVLFTLDECGIPIIKIGE